MDTTGKLSVYLYSCNVSHLLADTKRNVFSVNELIAASCRPGIIIIINFAIYFIAPYYFTLRLNHVRQKKYIVGHGSFRQQIWRYVCNDYSPNEGCQLKSLFVKETEC